MQFFPSEIRNYDWILKIFNQSLIKQYSANGSTDIRSCMNRRMIIAEGRLSRNDISFTRDSSKKAWKRI